MHLNLQKFVKTLGGIFLALGIFFSGQLYSPTVEAALVCCSGDNLSTNFSCRDSNSCAADQCAYVNSCFVCTQFDYGTGACEAAANGFTVYTASGCRPKTVCSDGTLTCGSCPSGGSSGSPPDPPPGCNNPGSVSFGAQTLIGPANQSVGLNPKRINFQWNRVASGGNTSNDVDWGQVNNPCIPQVRNYTLFVKKVPSTTACGSETRSTFFELDSISGGSAASRNILYTGNDLDYGATYCWFIRKSNSNSQAYSQIWKFSTDARPVLTSTRILNPLNGGEVATCGADLRRIGKYTASSTIIQNPIDIEVTWVDPDSVGDFKNIYLSFIPTGASNSEAQRFTDIQIQNKVENRRTLGVRYNIDNTLSVREVSTSNPAGVYSPNATSGDHINNIDGNAIVLGIGSATNVTLTNNGDGSRTVVARFRIRINDNFPNNNTNPTSAFFSHYNLYSMFIFTRSRVNGQGQTIITEYSGDINQTNVSADLRYMKTTQILYIDTTTPTPTIATANNPDSSFNITWRPFDSLGLRPNTTFLTAVHSNAAGDRLQENYPSGATINPVPTTQPAPSNLSAYLSLSNATNTTYAYRDQNSGVNSNYTFTLEVEDLSCNRGGFQLVVTGLPSPWVSVFNSNASIGNVLGGSVIPQITNYSQLFSLDDASDIRQPHTTAYAFLLGSTALPSAYISQRTQYVGAYDDLGLQPPTGTSWYSYFLEKVQNSTTPVTTRAGFTTTTPGSASATVAINTAVAGAANEKRNYIVNGNVTLNSRTNCNMRSIFVISGNLTIHSDYQITEHPTAGVYNGCIYVVQGSVSLINHAPTSSRSKFPSSPEQSTYGLFEASIFADGNITISRAGSTALGMFLVGNLATRGSITDSATFVNTDNLSKPSLLIYADPRYLLTFMDDLGRYPYSIREQGVIP